MIERVYRLGVERLEGRWLSLRNRTGGSARYYLDEQAARRWYAYLSAAD